MPYYSSSPDLGSIGSYTTAYPYSLDKVRLRYPDGNFLNITEHNSIPSTSGSTISLNDFRNKNIWATRAYPAASAYSTTVNMVVGTANLGKSGIYYGYDTNVLGGTGTAMGSFNGLSGNGPNYDGSPTSPSDRPYYTTPTGTYVIRALYGTSSISRLILTSTGTYPPNSNYAFVDVTLTTTSGSFISTLGRGTIASVYSYAYWYYRTEYQWNNNVAGANNLNWGAYSGQTIKAQFHYYG